MRNVLFFSLIVLFFTASINAKVIEKIVAIVNNEYITLTDLNDYRKNLKSGGLVDESLLKLTDPKLLLKNEKALVNHLINERLIDSEVKIKGLQATIEKVEKEIRTISKNNKISRRQLKTTLLQKGIKFSDYQDFIKTTIERRSLIEQEITSRIKISDEDIASYYISQYGAKGTLTYEYKIAHILFLKSNELAKKKAQKIVEKLKSNESFETLASQHSEDPNFTQGGILGTFKSGEMLKEIENAVKSLSVNSYSGVIETRAGFHVFKVLKKAIVDNPRIKAEKNKIHSILMSRAFAKRLRSWLEGKRSQAFIRIN